MPENNEIGINYQRISHNPEGVKTTETYRRILGRIDASFFGHSGPAQPGNKVLFEAVVKQRRVQVAVFTDEGDRYKPIIVVPLLPSRELGKPAIGRIMPIPNIGGH